nr:hypothetical protein [Pseudomonas sp. BIGb0427]
MLEGVDRLPLRFCAPWPTTLPRRYFQHSTIGSPQTTSCTPTLNAQSC